MRYHLETQGFDVTPAIRAHVDKQLHFNLANFESHVMAVDVYLRDVNGPKGGPDKKALIHVRMASRLVVTVESTRSDLYAAIILAARQSRRAVKRTLQKHRRMEKLALRSLRQFPQL